MADPITSLTRTLKSHWLTTEAAATWLADLVLDLSAFTPGGLAVTFTADIVVGPTGSRGVVSLFAGGDPQTDGEELAAIAGQNGPYTGRLTGSNAGGITATSGPDILHLMGSSNNGQPVEISNVVVTITDTR